MFHSQGFSVTHSKYPFFLQQDSRSVVTMDTGNTMMSSIGNQPDNVTLAMYDGNQIALTVLPSKVFKATPGLIAELNEIRTLTHPNLHRLIGICLDEQNFCEFLAQEACLKGSLEDVLENETIKLDWSFKFSLLRDLTEGMHYLHGSVIISHGLLSARNCLVDNRFMVKISNYGIRTFVPSVDFQPLEKSDEGRDFKLLLWRAPELLRQVMPPRGTQKGDVYGYGIIISQLILRCEPFDTQDSDNRARGYGGTDKEILLEVKQGSIPPLRPQVPRAACSPELYQLMERCWSEYPIERPSFVKITEIVRKIAGKASNNIIDHLLRRMEQYANSLEEQVAQKTEQVRILNYSTSIQHRPSPS
ncbi:hypothetical protein RvY_01134-2 [Ramazzottius varieornatus]|uniref:guanylate cyclase n=1 Tax=Ramazzottius varieornatus TaxID=947166 RepID=A0A1D1UPZ3_RAMVA|nr:hypothetical protein RvY_01134-2 [Ramazzottius varieornatus]